MSDGGGVMPFRAFTCAATNAAGLSRLVGLLFVPAEVHRSAIDLRLKSCRLRHDRWRFLLLQSVSIGMFHCSANLDCDNCQKRATMLATGTTVDTMVCSQHKRGETTTNKI